MFETILRVMAILLCLLVICNWDSIWGYPRDEVIDGHTYKHLGAYQSVHSPDCKHPKCVGE